MKKTFSSFCIPLLSVLLLGISASQTHALTSTSSVELSQVIRNEILLDKRSSMLSPAQINELVALLTDKAVSAGISPQQIAWHPGVVPETPVVVNSEPVCNSASLVCILRSVLGEKVFFGSEIVVAGCLFLVFITLLARFCLGKKKTEAETMNTTQL